MVKNRLREIRQSMNLTMEQVSSLTGYPVTTIHALETGKISLKDEERIATFSKTYHVEPYELFVDPNKQKVSG